MLFIMNIRPAVICRLETQLKENENSDIKHNTFYDHINNDANRATGGLSILVKIIIPHRQFNPNTNLQAITVLTTIHKTMC